MLLARAKLLQPCPSTVGKDAHARISLSFGPQRQVSGFWGSCGRRRSPNTSGVRSRMAVLPPHTTPLRPSNYMLLFACASTCQHRQRCVFIRRVDGCPRLARTVSLALPPSFPTTTVLRPGIYWPEGLYAATPPDDFYYKRCIWLQTMIIYFKLSARKALCIFV